ncbi:hypothetical protein L0F63_002329 [Massospora cicadina]|nr:hypothetical protein L0F63_002329 [Massospora cicadina]
MDTQSKRSVQLPFNTDTQSKRSVQLPHVAIVGAGSVGSAIAYAIALSKLSVKVLLVDKAVKVCEGQVKDLEDSTFLSPTCVAMGTMEEAGRADIIIVTAGAKQQPGESRSALVGRNRAILSSIVKEMGTINPKAIWLVVANPVDVLTSLAQKLTGLPHSQVLGTGTFLDTERLRSLLSRHLQISASSIHCQVLGEHGDDQVVAWSLGTVAGGLPLLKHPRMAGLDRDALNRFSSQVARRAYDIIDLKGSTHFGIGACTSILCDAILSDAHKVFPVSNYHPEYQVYMSYPAVISRSGVVSIINDLPLTREETEQLDKVAASLKEAGV